MTHAITFCRGAEAVTSARHCYWFHDFTGGNGAESCGFHRTIWVEALRDDRAVQTGRRWFHNGGFFTVRIAVVVLLFVDGRCGEGTAARLRQRLDGVGVGVGAASLRVVSRSVGSPARSSGDRNALGRFVCRVVGVVVVGVRASVVGVRVLGVAGGDRVVAGVALTRVGVRVFGGVAGERVIGVIGGVAGGAVVGVGGGVRARVVAGGVGVVAGRVASGVARVAMVRVFAVVGVFAVLAGGVRLATVFTVVANGVRVARGAGGGVRVAGVLAGEVGRRLRRGVVAGGGGGDEEAVT